MGKEKCQEEDEDSVKATKDSAEEIAANAAVGKSAVQIVQEEIGSVANSLDLRTGNQLLRMQMSLGIIQR